jgi:purine nucleosidase/pyrimidine-specific ribonucleoside hydrolase
MTKSKILIDTDIGGDVEDAFALTLALAYKQLNIVGITTISGDTLFRAKVAKHLLTLLGQKKYSCYCQNGRSGNNERMGI